MKAIKIDYVRNNVDFIALSCKSIRAMYDDKIYINGSVFRKIDGELAYLWQEYFSIEYLAELEVCDNDYYVLAPIAANETFFDDDHKLKMNGFIIVEKGE